MVGECGGLNGNGLHRPIYLNAWSLVSGDVLGKIRRCGLIVEGLSLGVGFEVSKAHIMPSHIFSLPGSFGSHVSPQLLL